MTDHQLHYLRLQHAALESAIAAQLRAPLPDIVSLNTLRLERQHTRSRIEAILRQPDPWSP